LLSPVGVWLGGGKKGSQLKGRGCKSTRGFTKRRKEQTEEEEEREHEGMMRV
jgi:hypothetical protein